MNITRWFLKFFFTRSMWTHPYRVYWIPSEPRRSTDNGDSLMRLLLWQTTDHWLDERRRHQTIKRKSFLDSTFLFSEKSTRSRDFNGLSVLLCHCQFKTLLNFETDGMTSTTKGDPMICQESSRKLCGNKSKLSVNFVWRCFGKLDGAS